MEPSGEAIAGLLVGLPIGAAVTIAILWTRLGALERTVEAAKLASLPHRVDVIERDLARTVDDVREYCKNRPPEDDTRKFLEKFFVWWDDANPRKT